MSAGVVNMKPSLAGGEISPALAGRVDLEKYQTSLKTCKNWIIHPQGGASVRAGTALVGAVDDESNGARLIPFQFNTQQAYVLEMGHHYMRPIANGGHIVEEEQLITGATNTAPIVLTIPNHGYAPGDEIFVGGVTGMVEINGRNFGISAVSDINHVTLHLTDGTAYGVFTGCVGGITHPDPSEVPGGGSGSIGDGTTGGGGEPSAPPTGYYENEDPPPYRPPYWKFYDQGEEP